MNRNLIYRIYFIAGILILSSCSSSNSSSGEDKQIKVSSLDYAQANEDYEEWAEAELEVRKDLYRILIAMNDVTNQTFLLERKRENNGSIQEKSILDQIRQNMQLLKEQLEAAKKEAGQNEQLLADIEKISKTIENREYEINRLRTDIATLDDKIAETVQELKMKKQEMEEEMNEIDNAVVRWRSTKEERVKAAQNALILAGDKVVAAAQMLPYDKNNSIRILKNFAIEECYNEAIRIQNDTEEARKAKAKGNALKGL